MAKECERAMYDTVCKDRFDAIDKRDEVVFAKIDALGEKLSSEMAGIRKQLLGNGQPGVMGRITRIEDKHEVLTNRWKWIFGVVAALVAKWIYDAFQGFR